MSWLKREDQKGIISRLFFNSLKARMILLQMLLRVLAGWKDVPVNIDWIKQQLMKLYSSAIDIAYRSEDDMLVAYVSYVYGSVIILFGEVGLSVMYAKNGIDLYEKLSYPVRASSNTSFSQSCFTG